MYKLVPLEPTREMWAAAGDAVVALESRHHDAVSEAVYKAMLAAASEVEQEPVAFDKDAALTMAERTFSTKIDEQLAVDIAQYAQRLHALYTATHPVPAVAALVEALERIGRYPRESSDELSTYGLREVARKALAAYRKQEPEQ